MSMPVLITSDELAKQLAVQPATLRQWRLTGDGPPFCKVGRRVLYRESDVSEWLARSVRRSTSKPAPFYG